MRRPRADGDPVPDVLGMRLAHRAVLRGANRLTDLAERLAAGTRDVKRANAVAGYVRDFDVRPANGVRVVQLTPPGSACSIGMGTGLPTYDDMAPGAIKGLHLVVADIEQARADLLGRGVDVGEVLDVGGGVTYAWLTDPDGNTLTLQEMAWRTGEAF